MININELDSMTLRHFNGMFIDADEMPLAILGQSYLGSYLLTGVLKKGYCVVTNKRIYFSGRMFQKNEGQRMAICNVTRTVDLEDFVSSGIDSTILPYIFVTVPICTVLGVVIFTRAMITLCYAYDFLEELISQMPWVITGAMNLTYATILSRKGTTKLFDITYHGGCFGFNVSDYSEAEISEFQKTLHRHKQSMRANADEKM